MKFPVSYILGIILCIILQGKCQSIKNFSIRHGSEKPLEGTNVTFICEGVGTSIQWQHRKHILMPDKTKRKIETEENDDGTIISHLYLTKISLKENGKYRCIVKGEEKKIEKNISLHIQVPPQIQEVRNHTGVAGSTATLSCTCRAVPNPSVQWLKHGKVISSNEKYSLKNETESALHISQLAVGDIGEKDVGEYKCQFENTHGVVSGTAILKIQELPVIELLIARSLGPQEIQLHWSLELHDAPLLSTQIYVVKQDEDFKELIIPIEPPTTTSVVLGKKELEIVEHPEAAVPPTLLEVVVEVTNAAGSVQTDIANITMLRRKPHFKPEASFRGSTKDSLSVAWKPPNEKLVEYIDLYRLSLTNNDTGESIETIKDSSSLDSLFTNLIDGTLYRFSISACMKFVDEKKEECGPPSRIVSQRTLSEPPDSVSDVLVECSSNRTSGANKVYVMWIPSDNLEKKHDRFKIELKASANFINEDGRRDFYNNITYQVVAGDQRNLTFENVHPNTNYTVKVIAGNKKAYSSSVLANCETPFWLPKARRLKWWKSKLDKRIVLKLQTPNVSQRNGTICCHRIVVVRLSDKTNLSDLPAPVKINLLSYNTIQSFPPILGGYVAEAFTRRSVTNDYLYVGDGEVTGNWSSECARCLGIDDPVASAATKEKLSEGIEAYVADADSTDKNYVADADSIDSYAARILPYSSQLRRRSPEIIRPQLAEDGYLLKDENYTGYLIMSVRDKNGTLLSSFSDFFNVIQPIEDPHHMTSTTPSSSQSPSLTSVIYILGTSIILLALMAIVLGILLCHYHKKRKQLIDDGIDESLTGSLGRIFRTLRRSHTLMSQPGIDVKPIPKDELVAEYLDKIKDSELGFRREFEALPEKVCDRSSRASEMSENSCKNRYPDIKAYDQTRVKLSQINGIVGSNYINANYVMGYKERKKFICAQGPMESTVNDFWRMIVEQRSSLCIMLTNLEETGKIKCVKYWPEAGEPKTFGNITVRLVKEKPYADYMVRTLRAEWTVSTTSTNSAKESSNGNSTNSTSAAENGVSGVITSGTATTKSNSSVCNSNSNSNYNSLSSNSVTTTSEETKFHELQQYHYLVWKDFVAPEHPVGLLSFLRRINEAYSPDLGPLIVHCSAGVGRTGTLVALDTLVTELDEENQASIFNIICDLRHQRNFLVQSLKQYVFVHRALMEHAQFGNSEQSASKLTENYKRHTNHNVPEESTELEKEFERLRKVIEDRKAFTVANSDSNKSKNRYDYVLPYDTNCVILTPLPTNIAATYINASFVTGFDLGENFIITQDPLENTFSDFWRMTYEQEVTTIVMLSELSSGENCCSKYWPDEEEEVVHEYVTVKFISSESYPKYTTRTFTITNNKNGDMNTVTQFQYIGWSGLVGEVPLVTLGIMEVITRVQSHNDINSSHVSPTVVHCSSGGDRSSVYVCLSNCLRQLRRESCVDVFQTVRKIRAQRQFQLQEFAQYEFIYKALVEYFDMKKGENL